MENHFQFGDEIILMPDAKWIAWLYSEKLSKSFFLERNVDIVKKIVKI